MNINNNTNTKYPPNPNILSQRSGYSIHSKSSNQ